MVSADEDGKGRMSYMFVMPEAKSDRERFIRVAQIVIVTAEGS
jgi:hypothetical protein